MKQLGLIALGLIAALLVVSQVGVFTGNSKRDSLPMDQIQTEEVADEATEASPEPVVAFEFGAIEDDTIAFDLLKESAEVVYDEYDFGVMVTSINGMAADDDHYWALYVNGEYAPAGADATVLATGDTMRWVYEKIDKSPF
ncbi:MAG: hypothetical protein COU65_03265 [Candidatus Pacebacteria bacterium CG10_big_fil_rev_8_21_14_0_10_42_12]|nr:DUF4430 domain-containing protein [Candidatus Paceibacterota bacterium]PIR62460.1 MAG: hypothetical protein COU65_03265 [Candidatus Pacebacteria bacterium CG10_big_fil_rev_8_21_14_0_10_42_12]